MQNCQNLIQEWEVDINFSPRDRSLEESMIIQTYNRFRISDSSKDFLELYGESALFSKILEIDSESLKATFISKIQKNHRESSESARVSLRSLEINALKLV